MIILWPEGKPVANRLVSQLTPALLLQYILQTEAEVGGGGAPDGIKIKQAK